MIFLMQTQARKIHDNQKICTPLAFVSITIFQIYNYRYFTIKLVQVLLEMGTVEHLKSGFCLSWVL